MAKTNPARGMRDFLPVDVRKREYVIGIIKKLYESYGYEPLETPAAENIDTLMGKYGEEGNQLIFKILKRGEKLREELRSFERSDSKTPELRNFENSLSDLALRYDLTVPLARVVADRRNELPKFFKRYQIQPVWRADRPARGRFREFYQCDVDAIGSSSSVIEAEIITAAITILERLGFKDFKIRINHRAILTDILDTAGVRPEKHNEALVAIDKLDKIGTEGVRKELTERGLDDEAATMLTEIFSQTQEIIEQDNDVNKTIVSNLINIVSNEVLAEVGTVLRLAGDARVQIDPSLARGLSYYTGIIIEINVPDLAGSLGGGGRYDGLIGMFGKEQIPACGFSLGLERILVVMDERGMFPPEIAESRSADVMVTIWSEGMISESIKLADDLRKQGLRVLLYPETDKLGKQMKYADIIRVPFVCILGPDETEKRVAKLKNMRTGEETTGSPAQVATVIASSR